MPLVSVSKSLDRTYLLTFKNGQKVITNVLALAIPCSIYDSITFEEEVVSQAQLASIKNVQYGTNLKIVVPLLSTFKKEGQLLNDRVVAFVTPNQNLLTLYCSRQVRFFSQNTIEEAYLREHALITMGLEEQSLPYLKPVIARDKSFARYIEPAGHSWPNDLYINKESYS